MKTIAKIVRLLVVAFFLVLTDRSVFGQSRVVFNESPLFSGTNYTEAGLQFKVIVPTPGNGSLSYDSMAIVPGFYANNPSSATPYMLFISQKSPDDFVTYNLLNGFSFGLLSVDLADAASPSTSPDPITFLGFYHDGTSVSQTFTTPGNGASTFQNYSFNSAFASGLTSVEIHASRWAMDNLVFAVPEPGTVSIGLVGLATLALLGRKRGTPA